MADTSVAITAGTGTNIDVRTEATNGDARQVVVLGDPSVNLGVAPVQNTTVAGTEYGLVTRAISNGDVAAGGTDAGNPVKVGGIAKSSEPTALTTAQRANFYTDLVGKHIVLPYANPENFVVGVTAAVTDTTSTSVIAAQAAGVRTYITSILVTNSHATVGTFIKILDGSTIIWEGYAAAAGGGFSQTFPVALRGSTATAVNAQAVTTGSNFICSIAGYKGV